MSPPGSPEQHIHPALFPSAVTSASIVVPKKVNMGISSAFFKFRNLSGCSYFSSTNNRTEEQDENVICLNS